MKATDVKFFQFLRNVPHFVIPIYQRPYSWTRIECTQLWNDLMFAGSDDNTPAHFLAPLFLSWMTRMEQSTSSHFN